MAGDYSKAAWGIAEVAIGKAKSLKTTFSMLTRKGPTRAVEKYDVAPHNQLQKRSVVGDEIEIHHVPQQHTARQTIDGYNRNTAPAIALGRVEHQKIGTLKGPSTLSPRDQLAKDVRDLRRDTLAPNTAIQDLIGLNKFMFREMRK